MKKKPIHFQLFLLEGVEMRPFQVASVVVVLLLLISVSACGSMSAPQASTASEPTSEAVTASESTSE
ncbi:MAG TPA: hypothetical protein VEC96_04440, partial [Anaerolineae bacterium]|nr:hypothetical protein [Anaerolineae bacterium]